MSLRSEPEVDDVAVLDDVLLALEAELAVFAAGSHGAARDQMIVADHFGANKSAGDVAMDLAGGQLRGGSPRHRPGTAFVLAHREERNIPEQIVAGADDAIEPRFVPAGVRPRQDRPGSIRPPSPAHRGPAPPNRTGERPLDPETPERHAPARRRSCRRRHRPTLWRRRLPPPGR